METAWRFAFLLTGCHEGASKVFKDSVEELLRHPHPGDLDRTRQLFFTAVRRRGLKFPRAANSRERRKNCMDSPNLDAALWHCSISTRFPRTISSVC